MHAIFSPLIVCRRTFFRSRCWAEVLLISCCAALAGCGCSTEDEEPPAGEVIDVSRQDASEEVAKNKKKKKASKPAKKRTVQKPPTERLALKLEVGQTFPLVKTVEQTLTQELPTGPATSTSRLELQLSLSVESKSDDGKKLLRVTYDRVKYAHSLPGEEVSYDSARGQAPVPAAVLAYTGLINNSFSFWLGADNQLIELVGYERFLEQCLRHVPPARRGAMTAALADGTQSERIATLIDESIGLLPYGVDDTQEKAAINVGESWTRKRTETRPVAMRLETEYTLSEIDERLAQIDVKGRIKPASGVLPDVQQVSAQKAPGDVSIAVKNGYTSGYCHVARKTGMPVASRVERHLDMLVQMPDGTTFPQHKSIVTTIESRSSAAELPADGNAEEGGASEDAGR